jgi:hypothetical protein
MRHIPIAAAKATQQIGFFHHPTPGTYPHEKQNGADLH